jgi:hypothetical protein
MRKIERAEILDLGSYEGVRARFVQRIIALKKNRRVSLGDHMTFVFENRDTMLFQIQEMLRTERITNEKGILHEIATYNDLVPGTGELSATLLIEYDDRDERHRMLRELADLESHVHLVVGNVKTTASFQRSPGEEPTRLPAVNYVLFRAGRDAASKLRDKTVPAAIEIDHPKYGAQAVLSLGIRHALAEDLDTV